MKLATLAMLKEALTIGEGLDLIEASLESALHNTTPEMASATLHAFDAVENQTDDFFLYSTMSAGNSYTATLALRQGFLTDDEVVVTWAGSYLGLDDGAEVADASEYRVDRQKGAVIINSLFNWRSRYVRVVYNAGFPVDGGDPEMYDLDVVPDWLTRAAVMVAAGAAITLNPDLAGSGQGLPRNAEKLTAQGMKIAETNLRYFPSCIRPI